VRIKLEGYRCMPAPHALYSKMLAERTASRNVLVLFYLFIYSCGASINQSHQPTINVRHWTSKVIQRHRLNRN